MMKFFRKHNRKLLAVFMALLLVVWLGGSALQSLITPSSDNRVVATSSLGDIVELDLRIARFETGKLERLGLNWQQPWAFSWSVQHEPLGLREWILLAREAEDWGMMPRQVEVEGFLASFGLTPDTIMQMASREDIKTEGIYRALAKYIGVFSTVRLTVGSQMASEAAMRVRALGELEKVKINLVSIAGEAFIDPDEEFTEDEIQSLFDEHRGDERGPGINFGYYQPPKIKVQYLKIDVDTVAENLRIRDKTLDSRAREYWRENKPDQAFRRPAPTEAEAQAEKEFVGPQRPRPPYFETYEEAREIATGIIRHRLAVAEIEKLVGWLQQELSQPWFSAPERDDGYKIGAEELLVQGYYESVLERLPAGLRFGQAVSVETTDYFQQSDAFQVPEIGSAWSQVGGMRRVLREDAFLVEGVEPMPSTGAADTSFYLALGQSSPVAFEDRTGSRFVYRVIEVKPAGPLDSLDDVREQVVEDLRLQRAYGRAKEAADRLIVTVTFDGLKAAWDKEEELKGMDGDPIPEYYSPQPFGRRRSGIFGGPGGGTAYISGLGLADESIIEQCFAMEELSEGVRVQPIYLDQQATVAVVEWVERTPLRSETYKLQRTRIARQMNNRVVSQAIGQWLDPARVRDRNGLELSGQ